MEIPNKTLSRSVLRRSGGGGLLRGFLSEKQQELREGHSGSTLIGAEATGRTAHLMGIDPAYTDVVRERWAEFVEGKGCDWDVVTLAAP